MSSVELIDHLSGLRIAQTPSRTSSDLGSIMGRSPPSEPSSPGYVANATAQPSSYAKYKDGLLRGRPFELAFRAFDDKIINYGGLSAEGFVSRQAPPLGPHALWDKVMVTKHCNADSSMGSWYMSLSTAPARLSRYIYERSGQSWQQEAYHKISVALIDKTRLDFVHKVPCKSTEDLVTELDIVRGSKTAEGQIKYTTRSLYLAAGIIPQDCILGFIPGDVFRKIVKNDINFFEKEGLDETMPLDRFLPSMEQKCHLLSPNYVASAKGALSSPPQTPSAPRVAATSPFKRPSSPSDLSPSRRSRFRAREESPTPVSRARGAQGSSAVIELTTPPMTPSSQPAPAVSAEATSLTLSSASFAQLENGKMLFQVANVNGRRVSVAMHMAPSVTGSSSQSSFGSSQPLSFGGFGVPTPLSSQESQSSQQPRRPGLQPAFGPPNMTSQATNLAESWSQPQGFNQQANSIARMTLLGSEANWVSDTMKERVHNLASGADSPSVLSSVGSGLIATPTSTPATASASEPGSRMKQESDTHETLNPAVKIKREPVSTSSVAAGKAPAIAGELSTYRLHDEVADRTGDVFMADSEFGVTGGGMGSVRMGNVSAGSSNTGTTGGGIAEPAPPGSSNSPPGTRGTQRARVGTRSFTAAAAAAAIAASLPPPGADVIDLT